MTAPSAEPSTSGPPPVTPSGAPVGAEPGRVARMLAGVRAVMPLVPGVIPFAMVSAYACKEADLSVAAALGMSTIIFAGASQMAFVALLASGAVAPVILATVLIINMRMVMYSASLAPHLSGAPWWARALMSYMLTDQAYAVSITRFNADANEPRKPWFFFGAAVLLWIVWQAFTLAGMLLGAEIPPEWGLDFTVPLVFLVLLVPAIRDRPSAEAAIVGGGLAVVLAGMPFNLSLVIGAVCGIAWGVWAEDRNDRWRRRTQEDPSETGSRTPPTQAPFQQGQEAGV